MLPKNWGEPMAAPAIFEKQIEIKLLHSASTEESRIQGIVTAQIPIICFPKLSIINLARFSLFPRTLTTLQFTVAQSPFNYN
ncbi:MAG: hypothetical protein P8X74_11040 [Reinekea sp.]